MTLPHPLSRHRGAYPVSARSRSRRRARPGVERVEARTLLATLTVNTMADNTDRDNFLTLREAIDLVDDPPLVDSVPITPGERAQVSGTLGVPGTPDTIAFNIPGTGVQTIIINSPLPTITQPVVIDGDSQPGAQANTLSNGDDAALLIELSGPGMNSGVTGLDLATSGSTVQGLVINRFSIAINVSGDNNLIQGNFVGTDPTGTQDFWPVSTDIFNGPPYGVQLSGSGNAIGTGDAAGRNIISGFNYGVVLRGTSQSVVAGNYIGTDRSGTQPLGNWVGIGLLGGATGDRIGVDPNNPSLVGEGNLISANDLGIALGVGDPAPAAIDTGIYGNDIGTDVNGTNDHSLGNQWAGVAAIIGSQNCSIGSDGNPALGNTIAFNGGGWPGAIKGPGVWIAPFRAAPTGIRVQGNSIHDNAGLGIDIGGDYPSPGPDGVNDLAIPDGPGTGANNLQHDPVLQTAQGGPVTSIGGTLSSSNPGPFTLDFYASPAADPSGHGEGARYLGTATINAAGSFSVDLLVPTSPGEVISATATDAIGDTSEFSQVVTAGSATTTGLQDVLTPGNGVTITTSTALQFQDAITAIDALSPVDGSGATLTIDLGAGTYGGQTLSPPAGVTVIITASNGGATFVGHSPALTVSSGRVIVRGGVTFTNSTAAPTILVTGGNLVLRNDQIEESDTSDQAAILISGGTVDLGTADDPGGNIINVNGDGELVHNTTGYPVPAVGDSFTINGVPLAPSSLSGTVFADFNDDGQVDFGEQGIAGVAITLGGTDFLGNPIHSTIATDGDGAYVFPDLLPGHYTISEAQPAGYTQGINSVGTGGGAASLDRIDVLLAAGLDALNDNFGERPAATGAIRNGQTAGIGFWNNKNGQALIKALNGGVGTQLGDWLAATFPHLFGAAAGANDLAGKSNAFVASFFQSRFVVKDQKLDAQVLATALAVYVTDGTLDSTGVGTRYGFTVGGNGGATAKFNVGSDGAAFGVANNTTMIVMDLLLAADSQAVNGILYGGNTPKRNLANAVFSAINDAGGI